MQRLTVILALVLWAVSAQAAENSCGADGRLDYRVYVFNLLNAHEGASAVGWPEKMAASGLPMPLPNVPPNQAVHFGITQSIGGDGGPRGRVWLPTAVPETDENGNRWFTRTIDIVKHETQTWMWLDRGGNPPLVVECGTLPEPPEPVPPVVLPPAPSLESIILAEVQALRAEEAARWLAVQKTYAQLVGGVVKFLGKYVLPLVGGYLIGDQFAN